MVAETLLAHVPIPYLNVHPMPVPWCDEAAASQYQQELKRSLHEGALDYVVLGVGGDGHTASLFPHEASTKRATARNLWVLPSRAPANTPSVHRLTLSYTLINAAREVGVLLVGQAKRPVVAQLVRGTAPGGLAAQGLPILGVRPAAGRLTWYISYDAL